MATLMGKNGVLYKMLALAIFLAPGVIVTVFFYCAYRAVGYVAIVLKSFGG